MDMLYAVDERDLVASAVADLADRAPDPAALAAVAALVERREDARIGAAWRAPAVGRGLPFEYYAYRSAGLPRSSRSVHEIEPHIAYAIAPAGKRLQPACRSGANAQGLMQVLPGTAKLVAKKNGVAFDAARLLNDPVYNVQIGAAELGDVIDAYRGSYILAFVAYNAGSRPRARMDRAVWRSARSQDRSDRLGRAHSVLRDPQLRAARDGEYAGLPRACSAPRTSF